MNTLCHVLALVLLVQAPAPPRGEIRTAFQTMLDRPRVPLDAKVDAIKEDSDGLVTETLSFASEKHPDGSFERVPVLVIRPEAKAGRRPAVIVLHGTGGTKEGMRSWLVDLAKRGFVALAIDARYHGARAGGKTGAAAYVEAITRAWRTQGDGPREHPFYYDTCWDLWRTLDYLETRDDVDPKRIGMVGISMGGIETWLAGSVDTRVAVAVPAIAVQSFRWSLENERWQGRARTITGTHQAAAKDLGESEVNAKVCRTLWNKIIPGILGPFDCPNMLPLFADRPLLIVNGETDPNCPIEGAERAFAAAEAAYKATGATDKLKIDVAKGSGHTVTPGQRKMILDWFDRWLKP